MKINLSSILLPAALLMISTGCQKYSYTADIEKFNDNIVFVEDQVTGTSHVSNEGQLRVEGNLAYNTFGVYLSDIQLYQGARLASGSVSNMIQYSQEKGGEGEDKMTPLYCYFLQENSSRSEGDLDISSLRYGFLSSTYWLSFRADERYNVWATPRVRTLYANYNRTQSPLSAGYLVEDAIQPGYKFTVDPERGKLNVIAQGVKFRQHPSDVNLTLSFNSFRWNEIDITFNPTGYSFYVEELIPIVDGVSAPQFKITDLRGEIAFDFEGRKTVTYKMLNGQGQNISVETKFDLLSAKNML